MIVGVGFSFYFISTKMIDGIYENALSADKNLLSIAGVSSLTELSKGEIQLKIDEQIRRYSSILNSQSRTLSYMKDFAKGVEDFHSTIQAVNDVYKEIDGKTSFSYLHYETKSASPLQITQFIPKDDNILNLEKKLFNKLGYKIQINKSTTSNWYKTSSESILISRGGS